MTQHQREPGLAELHRQRRRRAQQVRGPVRGETAKRRVLGAGGSKVGAARARSLADAHAGGLTFPGVGLASVVPLFMTMSGNAGSGARCFGAFDLWDPVLLSPVLAALPIIVVGEVVLRRAASLPKR